MWHFLKLKKLSIFSIRKPISRLSGSAWIGSISQEIRKLLYLINHTPLVFLHIQFVGFWGQGSSSCAPPLTWTQTLLIRNGGFSLHLNHKKFAHKMFGSPKLGRRRHLFGFISLGKLPCLFRVVDVRLYLIMNPISLTVSTKSQAITK